jgi:hypothetical protein
VEALVQKGVRELVLTDMDGTFIQTNVTMHIRDKVTGELLKDPRTGELFSLGLGRPGREAKDFERIQKQLPTVEWSRYELDQSDFGSEERILAAEHIALTRKCLQRLERHKGALEFVVTGRWHDTVAPAFQKRLQQEGLHPTASFVMAAPSQAGPLKFPVSMPVSERKAVTMAALIRVLDPEGTHLKRVTFLDDSDGNLRDAMTLLPRMFPKISLHFMDIVDKGGGHFVLREAASSGKSPGTLVNRRGRPMTQHDVDAYRSKDVVLPPPGKGV